MQNRDPEQALPDDFPEPNLAWPGDGPMPAAQPSAARRRRLWTALVFAPLLACAACVAVVFSLPLSDWQRSGLIPLTGGDVTPLPATSDAPGSTPNEKRSAPLTPIPMQPYRDAAEAHLITCSGSFETLYVLERMAMRHNEMVKSETWRTDATQALKAFRDDCGPLNSLPNAPDGYAALDKFIQQAAEEVGPAAEQFAKVLDSQDASSLSASMDHMLLFLEYTHEAANILNDMVDRKQI